MEMARRLHEMVESRNETREQIRGLVHSLYHSMNERVSSDYKVLHSSSPAVLVWPECRRHVAPSDPTDEWKQSSDRRSEQHQGGASVSAELVRMSQPQDFGWDAVGQQSSKESVEC
jgi:hypothetical protein